MTTVAAMTSLADHGAGHHFFSLSHFLECCIVAYCHTYVSLASDHEHTGVLPSDSAQLTLCLSPVSFSHQRAYLTGI